VRFICNTSFGAVTHDMFTYSIPNDKSYCSDDVLPSNITKCTFSNYYNYYYLRGNISECGTMSFPLAASYTDNWTQGSPWSLWDGNEIPFESTRFVEGTSVHGIGPAFHIPR
jgi:hypothetical protein